MKPAARTIAPADSTRRVIPAICPTSLKMLRGESVLPSSSRTVSRFRKPTLCPISTAPKVVKVITPNPPTWTRSITTTIPKVVNVSGKGTVASPVTLTALTETKKASTQEIPPLVNVGSFNNKVPRPMNTANPIAIRRGAESLLNNGQGATVLAGFLTFSLGCSLHVLDGNAPARAGPLDGCQVHTQLLGL